MIAKYPNKFTYKVFKGDEFVGAFQQPIPPQRSAQDLVDEWNRHYAKFDTGGGSKFSFELFTLH